MMGDYDVAIGDWNVTMVTETSGGVVDTYSAPTLPHQKNVVLDAPRITITIAPQNNKYDSLLCEIDPDLNYPNEIKNGIGSKCNYYFEIII